MRDLALQLQQGFAPDGMGFRGDLALRRLLAADACNGLEPDILGRLCDVSRTANSGARSTQNRDGARAHDQGSLHRSLSSSGVENFQDRTIGGRHSRTTPDGRREQALKFL